MKMLTVIHVGAGGEVESKEISAIELLGAKSALAEIKEHGVGYFANPKKIAEKIQSVLGVKCDVITPNPDQPNCQVVRLAEVEA